MTEYTPIQTKILELLSDGRAHGRGEVLECLEDPEATFRNLAPHIYKLRKILKPKGEHISCELHGRAILYRHVRFLARD